MAAIELNDRCVLNHRIDGTGTPALLLFNGASLPLEFWGGLALRLARHHRVVRFDQRNAGATLAEGSFSLGDVARDAARLLDDQGIDRVIAIGHAWGGRVAQVFVRDYPHRVEGLVLCGTGGQLPASIPPGLAETMRDAFRARRRDDWETALESMFCAPGFRQRDPQRFTEIADTIWHHRPASGALWDARIDPSPSYWGTSTVPTLLVYGRHDRNGTPANAADLAQRISHAELVMIEEAGHFVIRETEAEVARAIERFIDALPGGAR